MWFLDISKNSEIFYLLQKYCLFILGLLFTSILYYYSIEKFLFFSTYSKIFIFVLKYFIFQKKSIWIVQFDLWSYYMAFSRRFYPQVSRWFIAHFSTSFGEKGHCVKSWNYLLMKTQRSVKFVEKKNWSRQDNTFRNWYVNDQ